VFVVHGFWSADHLCLWAEDATVPPRRARGRAHPFAAGHAALSALLGAGFSRGTATLRFPGDGHGPLASPELGRSSGGSVSFRAWTVPVLSCGPDQALETLGSLPPDVVAGAGLRWLATVAGFACDLSYRGRVLPSVSDSGESALWRPLLSGPDAVTARALALSLPPAGRAEVLEGEDTERPVAAVFEAALTGLVDAAARLALPARAPLAGAALAALASSGAGTSLSPQVGIAGVDAWLSALTGTVRIFDVSTLERTRLVDDLRAWQRDAAGGAVRACFRLVEPETEDDDTWRLDFALQAADEPSLVVDAGDVWQSKGALKALSRHIPAPRETLLRELGRASRLYPDLDEALRASQPSTMDLDGAGAHRLLREGAPLLAAAGFGVLLPGWWSKPRARLGARLTARGAGTAPGTVAKDSGVGLSAVVDYKWQLALGDEPLTAEELARLTALKTPLVRLRGQWVELDPKRLAAGLKMVRKRDAQMSLGDLLRVAEDDAGPGGLPVVDVAADGWLGDLLNGDSAHHLTAMDAPASFAGDLRAYQKNGLSWLHFLQQVGLGGILADDMGLGKTVQLLALIAGDPVGGAPTLLVCPMSLVGNWQREAARFAPHLRVHVHHGGDRARGDDFLAAVRESDLVVTTYAIAARDAGDLAAIEWHRLVVDEAQAIKNANTRQAVAVRAVPARHRIAVTGTPVENRLADLWSLMEFANPGLLGPAARFKRLYAEPIERHGDEPAAARLRRVTQPFVLRRLKTDKAIISDLPEKLEMDVFCNLTAEQASLYQAVVEDMMAKIESSEGIERRGLILATMTRLKQVCNHPAQVLHDGSRLAGRSGKLERLEEILEEVLAADEKALLFTQYAEFGAMLRAHLTARFGREVAYLHGGLAKADRDDLVRRFQDGGPAAPPIFVLSLKAGGTGLTLTAANHVVHVDRWWNPAVEDQATDRAFRIGQRRAVQVRKFVCAGTVEEKIAAMIRDKRGLAASIVGTGEQWLTEMSTVELRSLLALEHGSVVE
jgi:non-specific serine/threonine protein kinase